MEFRRRFGQNSGIRYDHLFNWHVNLASDIYGSKATLLLASAIFLVGSVLCGSAVNMAMLLVGRGTQGIGGGGIIILVIICISELISMR
jgi:MFS family permease